MLFKQGRHGTGYLKLKLISFWFFDLYILKYPEGSEIPPHRDPISGKRHIRINYELKRPELGGMFFTEGFIYHSGRFAVFRSDICTHGVTKIERGIRLVLSMGVALPEKARLLNW